MSESAEEMRRAGFPSFRLAPAESDPGETCRFARFVSAGLPNGAFIEPTSTSTTPACVSYEFPLTEAQMEIWLATQLGNDASRAFNENILLQFKGTLDLDAMRLAVQRTVNRHEALRTTFSQDGSYQRVDPAWTIDIPLIDLSQLEHGNRNARLEDLITRELQQPFDLINGPLVRVWILRLALEEHFLLITAHHLVCDGWSIHVLLNDLNTFYKSPGADYKEAHLPQPSAVPRICRMAGKTEE